MPSSVARFSRNAFMFLLVLLLPFGIKAQNDSLDVDENEPVAADTGCVQKDIPDVIRAIRHMPLKSDETPSEGSLILMPIIGSNPATGFMIGVGGQYGFKLKGEKTKFSLVSGSVQFTTKEQKLFILKNSIYSPDNKIIFSGDWRYTIYSQSTYGLGTNAPEGGILQTQYNIGGYETSDDSLVQPLKFNFLRLYQSVSFKIKGNFYAGVGYYLDAYNKIQDEKLRLQPGDSLITSHYAYSKYYDFPTDKYNRGTFNVNLVWDTRDNIINPYKGYYLFVNWRTVPKIFGEERAFSFFNVEWRNYISLSQRNPRHLIGFWLLGDFAPEGELPYLILPATAYDQRGRSARGYTQGRFRGNNLVYGETEYRFPISQCSGVLGGVVFLNATTASNPQQELALFESIKPGYGAGIRIMLDKKTRTNLAVDYGFGEKSQGFYFAVSETF